MEHREDLEATLVGQKRALLLHAPCAVLLTGASEGYGRALAVAFAKEAAAVRKQVHFVLVSRNEVGMQETAKAVAGEGVSHSCFTVDLVEVGKLEEKVEPVVAHLATTVAQWSQTFDSVEVLVLHNAGSLGPLLYCRDIAASDVRAAIDLNVTAFAILTNMILRRFTTAERNISECCSVTLVNISSLAALEPFSSWSLYCAGKAARDSFIRCIAKEAETLGLKVRTLSWAPGPMHTQMVDQILSSCADPGVLENFRRMQREGTFVAASVSADKLVRVLAEDAFESGAHLDFYDKVSAVL